MNLNVSSVQMALIFSVQSFTDIGTSLYRRSSSCPVNSSLTEPRLRTHFSLKRRHRVTVSPFTSIMAVTSCGIFSMALPLASSVLMLNALRSSLSLPNINQVKASKTVVLPEPLRPEILVTDSLKLISNSLIPLKFKRESFLMITFFIVALV